MKETKTSSLRQQRNKREILNSRGRLGKSPRRQKEEGLREVDSKVKSHLGNDFFLG